MEAIKMPINTIEVEFGNELIGFEVDWDLDNDNCYVINHVTVSLQYPRTKSYFDRLNKTLLRNRSEHETADYTAYMDAFETAFKDAFYKHIGPSYLEGLSADRADDAYDNARCA